MHAHVYTYFRSPYVFMSWDTRSCIQDTVNIRGCTACWSKMYTYNVWRLYTCVEDIHMYGGHTYVWSIYACNMCMEHIRMYGWYARLWRIYICMQAIHMYGGYTYVLRPWTCMDDIHMYAGYTRVCRIYICMQAVHVYAYSESDSKCQTNTPSVLPSIKIRQPTSKELLFCKAYLHT